MIIRSFDKSPWVYGNEREAFRDAGWNMDLHVRLAKREAKRWREHMRGKKHGEGIGPMLMTIPKPIHDAAIRTYDQMLRHDRPKFRCWLWHRYPDFRCVDWRRCPWCGKETAPFQVAT